MDITYYLVNRSPSWMLDDMTPHEVWLCKKPSPKHIRAFGYDAYIHVLKENRRNLDKRVGKCDFFGYKHGLKGYNL